MMNEISIEVTMERSKKKLKVLVVIIVVLLISVWIVLLALGKINNNKPLYGEFIYMNDDGTNAKVILNENSVYFENVNFDSLEEMAATYATSTELNSIGEEYTKKEYEELRQKYLEQIDFENVYNKKEHSFDETKYIKEERQYYYYLYYPDMGKNGIDICVDLEENLLIIGDMEFQYMD